MTREEFIAAVHKARNRPPTNYGREMTRREERLDAEADEAPPDSVIYADYLDGEYVAVTILTRRE